MQYKKGKVVIKNPKSSKFYRLRKKRLIVDSDPNEENCKFRIQQYARL